MSPNDLSHSIRFEPFTPFRMFLTDGSFHDVRHPETIFMGIRTSMLYLPDSSGLFFSTVPIKIDNLHITRIVPLAQLEQAA